MEIATMSLTFKRMEPASYALYVPTSRCTEWSPKEEARVWQSARDRSTAHRVVVGVDFGSASLAAARWTARHLMPEAELVLVHVVEVPKVPAYLRGVARAADCMANAFFASAAGTRA